ncbi:MAG: hypothetical protein C4297_04445 [Gemmataceae bacterium]
MKAQPSGIWKWLNALAFLLAAWCILLASVAFAQQPQRRQNVSQPYRQLLKKLLQKQSQATAANKATPRTNNDKAKQDEQKAGAQGAADRNKQPAYAGANKKGSLVPAEWAKAPNRQITSAEIDQLIAEKFKADETEPAPLASDEQFLRRAMLDVTGKLPSPAEIEEFVQDRSPDKRARLIERLLQSEDFGRHWARYWRDVLAARATEMRFTRASRPFEVWLARALNENRPWSDIVREMITAQGDYRFLDAEGKNGAAYFLLCHSGNEAANERAAETARVFMGIQIQCAQCHDHPSDLWKRQQFHELAAFYARLRERPLREDNRLVGVSLISLPRPEHQMPDKDDPKKSTIVHPRFLLGQAVAHGLPDRERRQILADLVTARDNYWFAAAFVNRIWGELMGQAFYMPVDQMGPLQEATYPDVLIRLAASFRASKYDIKGLFRVLLNTATYQREIRIGDSPERHLLFSAAYPTRLKADSLWEALEKALGPLGGPLPMGRRPLAARLTRQGLQAMFMEAFAFDPSVRPDEIESSIQQALLLMNNPAIAGRISARGNTLLGNILREYPDNADALRQVYLRVLARKPTGRELEVCQEYIATVGNRQEAFEDILWSLINSTEFQSKR